MPTQLEGFGDGAVNPVAAAQQLALVQATYSDDLGRIAPMLLPSGRIAASDIDHTSWPPNYVIVQAGPDDWVIALGGTTGVFTQGFWHAWGVFGWVEEDGVVVNGQWRDVSKPILAAMLAQSGEPGLCRWRVSGHSYGGAVAQLVGESLKALHPSWRVEVLTFGSPKARGTGYKGPSPDVYWRLDSTSDAVPTLPFYGRYPAITPDIRDTLPLLPLVPWTHYGEEAILYPGGTIGVVSYAGDPRPIGVSVEGPAAHYVRNYWGRLREYWRTHSGSAPFAEALNILAALLDEESGLVVPPALPMGIPLASGAVIPNPLPFAPDAGPVPVGFFPGVPAMAIFNAPSVYKATLSFVTPDPDGWSETLTLGRSGEQSPIALKDALVAWIGPRRGILTSAATVNMARTSRQDVKGISKLWKGIPPIGLGPGTGGAIRVLSNTRFYFDIVADGGRIKGRLNVRGLPVASGQLVADETRITAGLPAAVRAMINNLTTAFIGPQNGSPTTGWKMLVKSQKKARDGANENPINAYLMIGCALHIDVIGGISGAVVGSTVILQHSAQKCIQGLSGPAKILDIITGGSVPAGITRYKLDRGFCCAESVLVDAVGKVRLKNVVYYEAESIEYAGFGTIDTGRPSGARAGRRKGRCC